MSFILNILLTKSTVGPLHGIDPTIEWSKIGEGSDSNPKLRNWAGHMRASIVFGDFLFSAMCLKVIPSNVLCLIAAR